MRTPFAECTPFRKNQKLHPLQLHFEDEAQRPELQELRALLTCVQDQLTRKILEVDSEHEVPIEAARRNTLIKEGRPRRDEEGQYPDFINIKFDPKTTPFTTEAGEKVPLRNVDLREYELQPVVWLRDVWLVQSTFYPRLFLKSCILHKLPALDEANEDDGPEESESEGENSDDMIEESQWR